MIKKYSRKKHIRKVSKKKKTTKSKTHKKHFTKKIGGSDDELIKKLDILSGCTYGMCCDNNTCVEPTIEIYKSIIKMVPNSNETLLIEELEELAKHPNDEEENSKSLNDAFSEIETIRNCLLDNECVKKKKIKIIKEIINESILIFNKLVQQEALIKKIYSQICGRVNEYAGKINVGYWDENNQHLVYSLVVKDTLYEPSGPTPYLIINNMTMTKNWVETDEEIFIFYKTIYRYTILPKNKVTECENDEKVYFKIIPNMDLSYTPREEGPNNIFNYLDKGMGEEDIIGPKYPQIDSAGSNKIKDKIKEMVHNPSEYGDEWKAFVENKIKPEEEEDTRRKEKKHSKRAKRSKKLK